jgi:hypothetical protein
MTPLSETQSLILRAAAQRDDGNVLPLPGSLRGGAAAKVVNALLSRGLVVERVTDRTTKADSALNRFWRNDEEGRAILLQITDAGRSAVGIAAQAPDSAPACATEAPSATEAPYHGNQPRGAHAARPWRANTKQALLIAMLLTERGATLAEIVIATGWQAHTVRGALAGALVKRLGLNVISEVIEGKRRYRIEGSVK